MIFLSLRTNHVIHVLILLGSFSGVVQSQRLPKACGTPLDESVGSPRVGTESGGTKNVKWMGPAGPFFAPEASEVSDIV